MTDSEEWAVLAENIEGAWFVPYGLCTCLMMMGECGAISRGQADRMQDQLYRYRTEIGGHPRRGYFWPYGQVPPRVRACRRLAELVAREGE